MNFWPLRKKSKKPRWAINLHPSVQRDLTVAGAWTTYAGSIALLRMGESPNAKGNNSPFDEECHARDALAEFWAVQAPEKQATDPYLQLLAAVRSAGYMQEYVWSFLRQNSWPKPADLKLDAFAAWCQANGSADHRPQTLAFVSEQ